MLIKFLPMLVAALVSGAMLSLAHYLLLARRTDLGSEARLPRQLILLAMTILSLIVLVVLAPVVESTRNQILGLIGILISGVIAISSTAFVTNFMAAIMLRVTRPFAVGDFITLGEQFGKVAERGLFDTEIQTDTGELIAIPNAAFISTPVKVIHREGTIITTTLSLGYDVHHQKIEDLLVKAASSIELSEPYVHVTELGDFSVTYRLHGFLAEPKKLITSRSRLNAAVLDTLHEAGIEIMSPNFARHIQHPGDQPLIPVPPKRRTAEASSSAEDVAFAKANQAEAIEQMKVELQSQMSELTTQINEAAGEAKDQLQAHLKDLEARLTELNSAPDKEDKSA